MAYDPRQWYSYSKERGHEGADAGPPSTLPPHLAQAVNKFTYQVNIDDKLLATVRNEILRKEEQKKIQNQHGNDRNALASTSLQKDDAVDASSIPATLPMSTDSTAPPLAEKDYRKFIDVVTQLQTMVQEIPGLYIKKLHYDMLCQIAQSLLDGTVFQIVKGLEDIQQLKERNLLNRRMKLLGEHKALRVELTKRHHEALQNCQCRPHQLPVLEKTNLEEKKILDTRLNDEISQLDQKLILEMDQQVSDQQATLQRAGVPLFFVTNKEDEIRIQMYILDFITRLTPEN